jgi:FRG domain
MVLPTYKSLEEKKEHFYYKEPEQVNTIDEFKERFEQLEASIPQLNPYLLTKHNKLCNTATVFRGQNEAKYKLYTSAQREWIIKEWNKQLGEDGFIEFVQQLILQLKKANVINSLSNYFESMGATETDLLLLSFLQHYRTPTPLLDFTYNKDLALFFAMDGSVFNKQGVDDLDNYFSIYALPARSIFSIDLVNKSAIETQREEIECIKKDLTLMEQLKAYIKYLFSWKTSEFPIPGMSKYPFLFIPNPQRAEKIDDIIGIDLHWSNPNIIAQEGCFVMNPRKDTPLEDIIEKSIHCLNIHKSLAPYIREHYLKPKGITKETIYPDFNAIAKEAYEAFKRNPTAKISLTDLPDSKD